MEYNSCKTSVINGSHSVFNKINYVYYLLKDNCEIMVKKLEII